jgi:hypothetical protein
MVILVGWFLALDKAYAVRAKLATSKLPEIPEGQAPFYLKVKVCIQKTLTS